MQRIMHYIAALSAWLGGLNWLIRRKGLIGLSWSDGKTATVLGITGLLRRPGIGYLAASLPVAVPLQLGLASLRRHTLNPVHLLKPGSYRDRRIARIDIPAEHGPVPGLHIVPQGGAKTAVLVAHGSGCDKIFYAWRFVDACIERGMAVLLIDLDGHGESCRPQDFPQIVASVRGPADWLRKRYEHVALLGMSLGGAVTARAVAEGAPCDALVLWAAPPTLRLTAEEYRQVRITETCRIGRPTLLHLFRDGSPYHVLRAWNTSGIRANIGTWDLFDKLDLRRSLATIKDRANRPPLLLYYAGRDAVLRPGADNMVAEAVVGWGDFRRIRRASHVSLPIEPEVIDGTTDWIMICTNRKAMLYSVALEKYNSPR